VNVVRDIIVTIAALVAVLGYFGIKPKQPLWGFTISYGKNAKLVVMLLLVAISLGMSGYSAYRAYHPKIVEKIVEKQVPTQCPAPMPQPTPQAIARHGTGNKQTTQQNGNNNQANPVTVNGSQTTNGAGSHIINGNNSNVSTPH
jgi:hypothetical protein